MNKVIYRMETYGEGDWHAAMCPELGILRTGKTREDARAEVEEAVAAYLAHCEYQGILDDALGDAGFEKAGDTWRLAPRVVEEKMAIIGARRVRTAGDCSADKGSYTYTSKSGISLNVTPLTEADIERKMSELEEKYGMTSVEFVVKYRTGKLDGHNPDFFDWEFYYDAAGELGLVK